MKRGFIVLAWIVVGLPISGRASFQAVPLAGRSDAGNIPVGGRLSMGVLGPSMVGGLADSLGFRVGEANEHVYHYEHPDGRRRQLSRLDWELKNIVMAGGSLSLRPLDRLTLNGGLWLALTEGTGEMEDFDWLEVYNTDWTHYSLSDVDVTHGYIVDLNVAWDLWAAREATVSLMLGYKQNGWKWEDRGVYLLYPEYLYIPNPLNGENMINYEQEFRMPYVGGNVEWKPGRGGAGLAGGYWSVSGYVVYGPYIWADDWDHHVARDIYYQETFEGGDMIGCGLEIRFEKRIQGRWDAFASVALDYQKVGLIIGDMEMYEVSTGETSWAADVAGIENEYLVLSIGGGLRF